MQPLSYGNGFVILSLSLLLIHLLIHALDLVQCMILPLQWNYWIWNYAFALVYLLYKVLFFILFMYLFIYLRLMDLYALSISGNNEIAEMPLLWDDMTLIYCTCVIFLRSQRIQYQLKLIPHFKLDVIINPWWHNRDKLDRVMMALDCIRLQQ